MQVKRIFLVAASTAAMTCRVPVRAVDSDGAELDCHAQAPAKLHALVHIDYVPTKRIVASFDSPTADALNGFDVEDGRTSSKDGWDVPESVSISDEKITWKKEAICVESHKCTTGSKRVHEEGSINRYTGQLTDKWILALPLDLGCEALQKKF